MRRSAWLHVILTLLLLTGLYATSSQPYEQQDLRGWIARHLDLEEIEERAGHLSFTYGKKEISMSEAGVAGFVEFFVRKGAHVLTFATLAALLYRTLRHWLTASLAFPWAALLAVLTAVLDEWHQTFTPNRTGMVADVVLDTASALVMLTLIACWRAIRGRRRG